VLNQLLARALQSKARQGTQS